MTIENKDKPHHFTVRLEMDSVSEGVLNQRVALEITEFAKTGQELTVKNMAFAREGIPEMVGGAIGAFDKMSAPFQQAGMVQLLEEFEAQTGMTFGEDGKVKKKNARK